MLARYKQEQKQRWIEREIREQNRSNSETVQAIQNELKFVPDGHREILKDTVKEIRVVSEGDSRYDWKGGIVYILENPARGEIIHELGHAIETRLDLYHDNEFLEVLNNGLESIS